MAMSDLTKRFRHVENSWAGLRRLGCGYSNYGTGSPAEGNGNWLQDGSSKTGRQAPTSRKRCLGNKANGFYATLRRRKHLVQQHSFSEWNSYDMLASFWDAAGNRTDGVTLTGPRSTS